MSKISHISELMGETLVSIEGMTGGSEYITFTCESGRKFRMLHRQDCCESVTVDDVVGEINDLIGSPIIVAEENTNSDLPKKSYYDDSYTWTFYKLATKKGFVDIRWYGTSNGYYSESVDFEEMEAANYRYMSNADLRRKILRRLYTYACNAYRDALNEMWDTNGDWIDDDMWWFDVADCVIGIAEVRELVDRNVDFDTFLAWYDYDMQIHYGMEQGHKEALRINLHTWLNGYPEEKKVPKETREAWAKEHWENL